jgi:catechol-2,3-dioxygenase
MHIQKLTLYTHELEEQLKFYSQVLNLPVSAGEDSFKVFTRSTLIKFIKSVDKPFYHFAFNIPQNKFHEALRWASARVDIIKYKGSEEVDFSNWNAHSFYFTDPSDNIIEFIARHDLKNDSTKPFDANGILCISEIGLPVHNVEETLSLLNKKFNIPFFDGNMNTFAAAGDDDGLFIIVPENRKWFPEYLESKIFPLKIEILTSIKDSLDLSKEESGKLPYKINSI